MTDAQYIGWGILILLTYAGWVIFWLVMAQVGEELWPIIFIPIPLIFLALYLIK